MFRHAQKRVSGRKEFWQWTEKNFVMARRESYHGQKRVLSLLVDRKEICHGQKRVLTFTEKVSSWTEKVWSWTEKIWSWQFWATVLLPLKPLIKRVSNTSLLLVKSVLGFQFVGTARRNARGWKTKQTKKEHQRGPSGGVPITTVFSRSQFHTSGVSESSFLLLNRIWRKRWELQGSGLHQKRFFGKHQRCFYNCYFSRYFYLYFFATTRCNERRKRKKEDCASLEST